MKNRASVQVWAIMWVVIFSLISTPLVMAEDVTEDGDTVSIGAMEYWAHTVYLPHGGGVEYEIKSTGDINAYFMDDANFERYSQGMTFSIYEEGSLLNTSTGKVFFSISNGSGGTYYLVVESAYGENVTFTYSLKYGKDVSTNPWDFFGYALTGTCCIVFALVFLLWIFVLVWVYRDAKRRGKSGVLWVLVVLFLGLLGLIIWVLIRPPLSGDNPLPLPPN